MDDAIYNLFLSVSADTLRKPYMAVNSYVVELLLQNCLDLNYPLSLLWDLIIGLLKCARDSVTVFHLQITYKLQAIEINLDCQLTCV